MISSLVSLRQVTSCRRFSSLFMLFLTQRPVRICGLKLLLNKTPVAEGIRENRPVSGNF